MHCRARSGQAPCPSISPPAPGPHAQPYTAKPASAVSCWREHQPPSTNKPFTASRWEVISALCIKYLVLNLFPRIGEPSREEAYPLFRALFVATRKSPRGSGSRVLEDGSKRGYQMRGVARTTQVDWMQNVRRLMSHRDGRTSFLTASSRLPRQGQGWEPAVLVGLVGLVRSRPWMEESPIQPLKRLPLTSISDRSHLPLLLAVLHHPFLQAKATKAVLGNCF